MKPLSPEEAGCQHADAHVQLACVVGKASLSLQKNWRSLKLEVLTILRRPHLAPLPTLPSCLAGGDSSDSRREYVGSKHFQAGSKHFQAGV